MTSVLDRIADFIAGLQFSDLSERAVRVATDAVTDAIGVGLAGSREPLADPLLATVPTTVSGLGAPLLGTIRRAAPADAALYNGAVIHALDYDDLSHPAYAHPSAHLVPVLLSFGEGLDGRRLLAGYAVGLELESRLGRALNMGHYLRGWHTTGTFGTLAAAAAAAKLLDFDGRRVALTLGIAASMASGLRANFGTMTKPLHAGLAARNGVLAARLAENGFTASSEALDGRHGFLEVYQSGQRDDSPWADLGIVWEITSQYGLAIKAFPSCGATHPAIEAAIAIRNEIGKTKIESIRVYSSRVGPEILLYKDPREPLQGKFSMEYCVSAALARGGVGLSTFSEDALRSPDIRDYLQKVEVTVSADPAVRDSSEFAATVVVKTCDSNEVSRTVLVAKGKPERWLSDHELRAKFIECAASVLPRERAQRAYAAIQSISDGGRLRDVIGAVTPRVHDLSTTVKEDSHGC